MKLVREIKARARAALRGRLAASAAVFLLWALAWGAVSFADGAVFRLLGYRLEWYGGAGTGWPAGEGAFWASAALEGARLVLLLPLEVGALAWFSALVRRKEEKPSKRLFLPYRGRLWLRSLGVLLYTGAVSWGAALLPFGAAAAGLWLFRGRLGALSPPALALLAAVGGVAGIAWLLAAWAFSRRYAMAPVLLGPDYGCTAREAVARSVECTRGHRWRLLWLDLSFLPWLAACLLVAPAFYALPYYTACRAVYSRALYERRYPPGEGKSP